MKDFQEIVKRIAREDNTTPEIVLKEMQKAIDAAYEHHDPAAQPFWDAIAFHGEPAHAGRVCPPASADAPVW